MSDGRSFEFISLFTNYTCNLKCSYCSERFVTDDKRLMPNKGYLPPAGFLAANKFAGMFPDLYLYIHGGEPLLYKGLEELVRGLQFKKITVVSSLSIPLSYRFSDFAGLKSKVNFIGSYHSGEVDAEIFLRNADILKTENMIERICAVEGFISEAEILLLKRHGYETVIYPFSGIQGGEVFPAEMRAHAYCWTSKLPARTILCRSAKFLIDPYGRIWNCSTHMYTNDIKYSLGSITDEYSPEFFTPGYFKCDRYGYCNPCQGPFVSYRELDGSLEFREFPGLTGSIPNGREGTVPVYSLPASPFVIT